jgi:hypothetical protein
MTQGTGYGKVPIYAETETKFFPTAVPAEIAFFKDDLGTSHTSCCTRGEET